MMPPSPYKCILPFFPVNSFSLEDYLQVPSLELPNLDTLVSWNDTVFFSYLKQSLPTLDWNKVYSCFDFSSFLLSSVESFDYLVNVYLQQTGATTFPYHFILDPWTNTSISVLSCYFISRGSNYLPLLLFALEESCLHLYY